MSYAIRALSADDALAAAPQLARVLIDVVHGGASVGFMADIDQAKAQSFWESCAAAAQTDGRTIFAAVRETDGAIVGCVQLIPAPQDNQPHRADIAKMLVLRSERRQGLGAKLLRAAEAHAQTLGKTLLTLDTASDDATRLYTALGWQRTGVIPNYALNPDGAYCDTIVFFKAL